MASFMAAEYEDLSDQVKQEVQTFADVNIAWLKEQLTNAGIVRSEEGEKRARVIYSAIVGAQLMARSWNDITLFDELIEGYAQAGLFPADAGKADTG